MSGSTNKGKLAEAGVYRGVAPPTNYYLALIRPSSINTLDAAAATDQTGGVTGIPITGHGYTAGDRIWIKDTVNYDGFYLVLASSTVNRVDITAAYVAETFGGTEEAALVAGPNTNTLADLEQIAVGNGYTDGGISVARNTTDFDVLTESDFPNNYVILQMKDIVFTASGGQMPATGRGAIQSVLTDDNATVAAREVLYYWDFSSEAFVSDTQTLTLIDQEMRFVEGA